MPSEQGKKEQVGLRNETRKRRVEGREVSQPDPQSPLPLWAASQQPDLKSPTLQGKLQYHTHVFWEILCHPISSLETHNTR